MQDETVDGERLASCQAPNCVCPSFANGYCPRHNQQVHRHGRLTPERERIYGRKVCQVSGCEGKHAARGYCRKHYHQQYYQPKKLAELRIMAA